MTKKILITGAFGFVGTNLSESLHNSGNSEIIALDIKEPENHLYNSFYQWNEIEKLLNIKLDTIIHLAGKAHDTKNTTEEKDYFDINLGLTKQVFDFYLKSTAKKFIFFSSVKAVADKVLGEKLTEDVLPNPQTAYGKSKLAAENYILNQKLPEDKKVYIMRPCMIHGPGNKGNLNLLFKVVQTGFPWPLGSFENKRSFTSIDNLCFVISKLLENEIESGVYNVADDESISTNTLIELIADSQNKKPRIWKINKNLIETFAKLGNVLPFPLNSERLEKLTESYVVSNEKFRNAVGIENMPLRAEAGMKRTLVSFS